MLRFQVIVEAAGVGENRILFYNRNLDGLLELLLLLLSGMATTEESLSLKEYRLLLSGNKFLPFFNGEIDPPRLSF